MSVSGPVVITTGPYSRSGSVTGFSEVDTVHFFIDRMRTQKRTKIFAFDFAFGMKCNLNDIVFDMFPNTDENRGSVPVNRREQFAINNGKSDYVQTVVMMAGTKAGKA